MPSLHDPHALSYVRLLTACIGKWQILLIVFTCTVLSMLSANDVAIFFYAPEQDFHCDSSNEACYINVELSQNNVNISKKPVKNVQYSMEKCSSWVYDETYWKRTIIKDWDLVCDRDVILSFMTYIYTAATISGYVIFGHLSDRYGRKKTVIVCMLSMISAGFILAFSVHYLMFAIVRFLIGFFLTGTELNCFIWMMESLDSRGREIFGMLAIMSWSIGLLFLIGVTYMLRDWTYIQVCITIPSLLAFFMVTYSMESPRWLMSVGRYEDCLKVLKSAAEMNKKTLPDDETLRAEIESVKQSQYNSNCQFMNLFRKATLRQCTLILLYVTFAMNFLSFPMILMSESINTEMFATLASSSSLEIIGVIIAAIELRKFGRKCLIVCNIIMGGILCFALMIIPEYKHMYRMGVAILGRTFVATAGCQLIIFSVELFPTSNRALGYGLLSMASRLGSVSAELITRIDYMTFPWASTALKLFLCLIAGLIAFLLPETKGRDLPNVIEDTCREPTSFRMKLCCHRSENDLANNVEPIPPDANDAPFVTTV